MFHPILAENSSLTLYMTLNAILTLLIVVHMSTANNGCPRTLLRIHISISYTTCTFAQLKVRIIEGSDNRGSDDRDWTAVPIEILFIAFLSDVGTIHPCPDPFLSLHRGLSMKLVL